MALVTFARYQSITGDTATPEYLVSARIEYAVELLEDELARPLASAERTETLWPTRDGRLWPSATPITDPGDYQVDGLALFSSPFPIAFGFVLGDSVDVTYTGGWVERSANPTAANRLPTCIERDLAYAANALGDPAAGSLSGLPVGVTQASVGDVSVTFGSGGAGAASESQVRWSRETLAYRYARVGGPADCPAVAW